MTIPALSTSQYSVLGLLSFGEQSGYELCQFADRSISVIWAPARSQIYKVLPVLVSSGLAATRRVEQRSRPAKNLYWLTADGRKTLLEWLTTVPDGADPDVFLLKIFFGELVPLADLIQLVSAYRELTARRQHLYQELDHRLPRIAANEFPFHVLELGRLRARATLEWADLLIAQLRRSSPSEEALRRTSESGPV